jgi:antitoxin component of RelBE/YafQ-DinJ toxin-antitoxin module
MDDIVTARLPQEIKKQGNEIFARKGTTPSKAINELYAYVVATGELPNLVPEPVFSGTKKRPTLTPEIQQKLETIRASTSLGIDWGVDTQKSYRQLIEEGRRADYEALT